MVAFVWALAPTRIPDPANSESSAHEGERASTPSADHPHHSLDASVFQVRLWNAPVEADQELADKPEPPPPPNLELIAIITESERRLAALYEVGADRLHVIGAGERIGRLEILQVDAGGVELRDGSRTYRLSISPAPVERGARLTLGPADEVRP